MKILSVTIVFLLNVIIMFEVILTLVCQWLVVFSGYWPPRYNWNIVESGVKHHKLNQPTYTNTPMFKSAKYRLS
jgi:hypothetical protein